MLTGRETEMLDAVHASDLESFVVGLADAGPVTVAVMVSSVDGRATIHGRVGALTGAADQRVLLGMRELASALVVGGNTVQAEGYDRLLDDDAQARRTARGLPPEPELVAFTRDSGDLEQVWQQLRARHPQGMIVCEGGPTLLGLVVERGLLDQLVLCISPQLVGGDGEKRIIEHAAPLARDLDLLDTAAADGFMCLRYGAA
jgi:riboflavin biosynthesis pyrimidine reductase